MIPLPLGGLQPILGPIVKVATSLIAKLPTIVETALKVVRTISIVIQTAAQILELSPHGEDPEELGAKAMQEDTRPKAEDESVEDYLNYLRNEVSIDSQKLKEMSDEDKIKFNAIGTSLLSQAIIEKYGVEISPDFLLAMEKMKMTGEQISKYIVEFSKNKIDSLDSLADYLRGELSADESVEIESIMENVERELSPSSSKGEILMKIDDARQALEE